MKKVLLALTAVAAMTGSASAADLAARPYTKAPAPIAAAPSWTGFYIFGGGGGGSARHQCACTEPQPEGSNEEPDVAASAAGVQQQQRRLLPPAPPPPQHPAGDPNQ